MRLRDWARALYADDDADAEDATGERERRLDIRYEFVGEKIPMRNRKVQAVLHLKDLSCKGAAGISDTPFAVGSILFLQFKKPHFHAAEVRWVRSMMIGLRFFRPLDPHFVERLHAAHLVALDSRRHVEQLQLIPSTQRRPARAL